MTEKIVLHPKLYIVGENEAKQTAKIYLKKNLAIFGCDSQGTTIKKMR